MQLALTYSQCPLTREECQEQLHNALDRLTIRELVIAQEHHTKEGLHLHVYVKLAKRYSCIGEHKSLHLSKGEATYKPNVQSVKDKLRWVKYLHKEDTDTLTEGINSAQYI